MQVGINVRLTSTLMTIDAVTGTCTRKLPVRSTAKG